MLKVEILHNDKRNRITILTEQEWLRRYKISGIVIWPRVYFLQPGQYISETLFRHELEHCYQVMRLGLVKFFFLYIYYRLRYGYRNHPLEIEAWDAQDTELTHHERKILWKLREG